MGEDLTRADYTFTALPFSISPFFHKFLSKATRNIQPRSTNCTLLSHVPIRPGLHGYKIYTSLQYHSKVWVGKILECFEKLFDEKYSENKNIVKILITI